MPQSDLLESLIYTTHHGAAFMLRRFGLVWPAGAYFIHEDDVRMDYVFPKEDYPEASVEELFAMVEAELRQWAGRAETCAIAMVGEIEREGRRVMVMQAETRQESVVLHYPLRKKLWWWVLDEPVEGEDALVEPFFGGGTGGGAGY